MGLRRVMLGASVLCATSWSPFPHLLCNRVVDREFSSCHRIPLLGKAVVALSDSLASFRNYGPPRLPLRHSLVVGQPVRALQRRLPGARHWELPDSCGCHGIRTLGNLLLP